MGYIIDELLIKARVRTDRITETESDDLKKLYATQADLYVRIAEAYIKREQQKSNVQ